jgi:hypothetical protein
MKIYKTTSVKEVLDALTKAVQGLVGKKQSAGAFHDLVEGIVNPILVQYGMSYNSWDVIIQGEYMGKRIWEKIFRLKLDSIEDKKFSRNTTWTNTSISFVTGMEGVDTNMTIHELLLRMQLAFIEQNQRAVNGHIDEFKDKIIKAGGQIAQYDREIATLKTQLGIN